MAATFHLRYIYHFTQDTHLSRYVSPYSNNISVPFVSEFDILLFLFAAA